MFKLLFIGHLKPNILLIIKENMFANIDNKKILMRKLDVNGKLIESKLMFYVADKKKHNLIYKINIQTEKNNR